MIHFYFDCRTLFPPKRKDLTDEMFRISGVSPQLRPAFLENRHIYDLCLAYEEIATRIPAIKKVDTHDPTKWRKYFDQDGFPLDIFQEENDKDDDARDLLRTFLHADNNIEHLPPARPSRRERKLLKSSSASEKFKSLFD